MPHRIVEYYQKQLNLVRPFRNVDIPDGRTKHRLLFVVTCIGVVIIKIKRVRWFCSIISLLRLLGFVNLANIVIGLIKAVAMDILLALLILVLVLTDLVVLFQEVIVLYVIVFWLYHGILV
jgi:hypothetical protein